MSMGSHIGTQVAQSPQVWGDNLSGPLAMINLPPHQSRGKWKKRRKGRWRKMRNRWKEKKQARRRRLRRGHGGCWAGGHSVAAPATPSGSSHAHIYPMRKHRAPHPDPFPGHVPQLAARENFTSTAEETSQLWSSQTCLSLSGENTFIKALVEHLNERLPERPLAQPPKSLVRLFTSQR